VNITDGGDVTAQSEAHLEEAHTALTNKVFKVMQRGKKFLSLLLVLNVIITYSFVLDL
jgi:hypothetical protein